MFQFRRVVIVVIVLAVFAALGDAGYEAHRLVGNALVPDVSVPADTALADTPPDRCEFINNDNGTGERSKHMNGYNVCVSAQIVDKATSDERSTYPLEAMHVFLELMQQREKLLRFNDPNKLGWYYKLGMNGNVVWWQAIQGKPSSTQSSMTAPWQESGGGGSKILIPSPADDGSFGPNEGGDGGVFFFTASGCLVEDGGTWMYSDCQLNINAQAVITGFVDLNPKPTSAFDTEFGGTGDNSSGQ